MVYRGILRNGKEVAVKKLDLSSLQGEREFQNELTICGGLNSPYVVSLLGYCTHGRRVRLLIYECMHNRSLQEALFEKGYPAHLDWNKRFKIIFDIAKALEFLHLECHPPIIHGDVKPSNILLDSHFSARIADFGLARFKTDDFWVDSARISTSTDRFRPDTPERFRSDNPDRFKFGTPDRSSIGTPEMSRSSTRNALSDMFLKAVEGAPSDTSMLSEEKPVVIDIPPTEAPRDLDDVVDGDTVSCSPNFSRSSFQPAGSEHLSDSVAETPRTPAADEVLSGSAYQETRDAQMSTQKDSRPSGADDSDDGCKAYPSEGGTTNEIITGDQPKELRLLPLHREVSFKKQVSGKDWWWRQDISGELSGKDYVMDWIGSEVCVNNRILTRKDEEIVPVEENRTRFKAQKSRLRPSDTRDELSNEVLSTEANKKDKKKSKPKHRKSREWWKDEYFAELSNKKGSLGNGKKKREKNKNVDSCHSGELSGYSGQLKRSDNRCTKQNQSKEWVRGDHSGDLSRSRHRERRLRPASLANEMWSGDLLNRQFSGDLFNRQWSGDLPKSGELVSRDVSSTTSMRGTVCYVPPEYGGSGILSEKGDIYSFGVLMLVILSGRRPIRVTASPMKEFEKANLISWARSLSQTGRLLDIMDEALHGDYDPEQANLCTTLALLCLQRVPAARPNISEVVKVLSGKVSAPSLPLELSPSPPERRSYRSPTGAPEESPESFTSKDPLNDHSIHI